MFDYQSVYNGQTALVAGLVTSVHCLAMCGPLSCAFMPNESGARNVSPHLILTSYHLAKLFAYMSVGALSGALGSVALGYVQNSWLNYLPWILVFFFLIVAFGLDRFFPKPVWLGRLSRRMFRRITRSSKPLAAGMIGLITPLLPCGPLYMIFGLAFFSGNGVKGAEFAAGFGIGTIPLLWLAQSQFMRLRDKVGAVRLSHIQRSVALVAAVVIAWRLRETLGIETAWDWMCRIP